jgi:hypothetical protein
LVDPLQIIREKFLLANLPTVHTPPYGAIVEWALDDSRTRLISPWSHWTVPDWVERTLFFDRTAINLFGAIALIDILKVAPTHPLIPFFLAQAEEEEDRKKFLIQYGLRQLNDVKNVELYGAVRVARYSREVGGAP